MFFQAEDGIRDSPVTGVQTCALPICLSIDKNLTRLGYGGGYFDKLRRDKNWRNVPCIGVLTSNCVSKIPLTRAYWDIPLSGFITEKEIFV